MNIIRKILQNNTLRAMISSMGTYVIVLSLALSFCSVLCAELSLVSVKTKDAGKTSRTTFSSTEKISFAIEVQNSAVSTGRIQFSFYVQDASGKRVFTQTGNSAPGAAGVSGSEIQNIPIEKFYGTPGYYTLEARAALDGSPVSGTQKFQISSPIITLSYPPNGSRDLSIQPLTFRWVSSGAPRYRIYVGNQQSLSLNPFTAVVTGTSFTYPENPDNEQHKLVSGQVYYWKVEGLDASSNVIARASTPFSFSVKLAGSQMSRDIAIKEITVGNVPLGPGFVPISIAIKNQGTTTESNVTIEMYVNGIPLDKTKKINRIESGRIMKEVFPVRLPEITDAVLITATHDIYDDNISNNRLSKIFKENELIKDTGNKTSGDRFDLQTAWEQAKRVLNKPDLVMKFEDYTIYGLEPDGEEGIKLFNQFLEGKAKVIKTQITVQR